MEAAKFFAAGHTRADVAERCGVSGRSAHAWHRVWSREGAAALQATMKPGPVAKFSAEEVAVLEQELRRGPVAHGYDNALGTLPRVGRLMAETFQRKTSPSEVWRRLRRMRWSPQKPQASGARARRREDHRMERPALAATQGQGSKRAAHHCLRG